MDDEDNTPDTQPEARLEPPARVPPTAVGTGTPGSDDSGKDLVVREHISVLELARLIRVRPGKVVGRTFHELGRLVTVHQVLVFEETRSIAAMFGYAARLREEWNPPANGPEWQGRVR